MQVLQLSVALTTYNGERFIARQLDSIASQSHLPLELVVTDDGSSDATLSMIDAFAATAPFHVHVHRNPVRLGYRRNFMRCSSLCQGDLIAFCDQDDVWAANKLACQVAHFADPTVFLSCHNAALIDANDQPLGRKLNKIREGRSFQASEISPSRYSPGFTTVIRRSLTAYNDVWPDSIDAQYADHPMAHDAWFFLLALGFGRVKYERECLALYRQHDQNASGLVPSSSEKLMSRLHDRKTEYRSLVAICRNRLSLLEKLKKAVLDDHHATAASQQAPTQIETLRRKYEALYQATSRRLEFYETVSPHKKLKLLTKAILTGDYSVADPWSFPLSGAVRDFIMFAVPGRS